MALKIAQRASCFFFCVLLIFSCQKKDRVAILAEYLKEERRVRKNESGVEALRDSLSLLEIKYGIDRDVELRELGEDPDELITLLRELKRAQ